MFIRSKNTEEIDYQYGQGTCILIKKMDLLLFPLYKVIPFSYSNIYIRNLKDLVSSKKKISVIDLGCGHGGALYLLNLPKNFEITGVDIFDPYIKMARKRGIYKKVIKQDIRKLDVKTKYDVVLANHVLEHLSKKEGLIFLKKIENMAKRRIIIATPIGVNPRGEVDSNPFQEHKSSWTVEEMKKNGYKVYSQGFKPFWGDDNIIEKFGVFSYFLFTLSLILTPVLLIKPELGTYMICRKDI